jgi:hypothetical protein
MAAIFSKTIVAAQNGSGTIRGMAHLIHVDS